MKFKLLIIVFFCANVLALHAQRPQKAYRIGKASYENGEYIRAIGWLTLAINAQKKKFEDAYLYRGNSYLKMGQPQEAVEDFKIATQILPTNVEAPLKSTKIMLDLKEYSQALQYATITLDRDTANFEALKMQALALALTGSAETALITADAIAEIRSDAELFYIKAVASDSLGLTDYAIAYYKEAIEKNKAFKPAYHALGRLLVKNGHYAKGTETFSDAARKFNDEESYYYRSLINNKLGNKQSEIVDITKLLTLNSAQIDLYFKRAKLFKDLNLLQNALSDIDIYLRWDSLSASAWMFKARLLNQLRMKNEARSAYEKILKISENQNYIKEAKRNIFELNTEDIPPVIDLKVGSVNITHAIMADENAKEIVLKGIVTDHSKVDAVKINGIDVDFGLLQKNKYVFSAKINSDSLQNVTIEAVDAYGNITTLNLPIIKTNPKNRAVFLTAPDLTKNKSIIANESQVIIKGYYSNNAFFSTVKINGKEVSKTLIDNNFHFHDRLELTNIDTLVIEATDVYSNVVSYTYPIIKNYNVDKETSAMGKTWVVIIASDSINELPLTHISSHKDSLAKAYRNFIVDSIIVLSGQSKEKLERALLFTLPRQLIQNRVDAVVLHYVGTGIKEPNFSYLIVDGDKGQPYAKINASFFKTVIDAMAGTSFKTLIMETIEPAKSLIHQSDSSDYVTCNKINRIPEQGVCLLSIPVKNWFRYRSPILKALCDTSTNEQKCFTPSSIIKTNKNVIIGGLENTQTTIFPVILYRRQ